MKAHIVIAEDAPGKFRVLYCGADATKAEALYRAEEKPGARVGYFRKPVATRRRRIPDPEEEARLAAAQQKAETAAARRREAAEADAAKAQERAEQAQLQRQAQAEADRLAQAKADAAKAEAEANRLAEQIDRLETEAAARALLRQKEIGPAVESVRAQRDKSKQPKAPKKSKAP